MADEKQFLDLFGFLMAQEFVKASPRVTSRLANSFQATLEVKNGVIHYTLPEYAEYVEFGTAPHIIKAKPGSALYWDGAKHPVKQVKHPGSRPNPFIRDTFNRKTEEVLKKTIKILMED